MNWLQFRYQDLVWLQVVSKTRNLHFDLFVCLASKLASSNTLVFSSPPLFSKLVIIFLFCFMNYGYLCCTFWVWFNFLPSLVRCPVRLHSNIWVVCSIFVHSNRSHSFLVFFWRWKIDQFYVSYVITAIVSGIAFPVVELKLPCFIIDNFNFGPYSILVRINYFE